MFLNRSKRTLRHALEYVDHGWPIAALATPENGECPCGRECEKPHLVSDTVYTHDRAHTVWFKNHPWDIALMCDDFDAVGLPTAAGAPLYHSLGTKCPTMTVFKGKWWVFIVRPGAFDLKEVLKAGGTIRNGPEHWAPAAPSLLDGLGRLYWVAHPRETVWTPYARIDSVDIALGTTR
jgi:hypothetical protein